MDDDDDFLEVDIDQIVQGHTSRGSGQDRAQPGSSQVGCVDSLPMLMGASSLPGSTGVLLPSYSNIYQSNTNEPTLGTTASTMLPYVSYGGPPPRPPQQQQSQQGPAGSPFQRMNPASRMGATGNTHSVRQSNAANAAATTSTCGNGTTATPPSGGPAAMPPGAHIPALSSMYQHPQNPSTTSVGAQPSNKPRNLGQQLGFGAPGAGQGTQGAPYGGYGTFNSSHNPVQVNTKGLREPACPPASTAPAVTAGPSATSVLTGQGGHSGAALAVPSNGATAGPNPHLPNHPSGSTRSGVAAAPQPTRPSYWPGGNAGGADPPPPANAHGLGGYGSQIPSGPGQPPPGLAGCVGTGAASGSGLYPGGGSCFGGSSGVAALHAQGHDMNALRAYNTTLEAQVETLKRQLQESAKLAKSAQSLQEQLQHVQAEAQDLQRKHREASIRLQEERSKGEAAERERKETQDKCLMLEAELHKARASGSATGTVRTPPPKKGMSPNSGTANRPRQGPEPYANHHCHPSQLQELQQQQGHHFAQQQQMNDKQPTGEVLPPSEMGPVTSMSVHHWQRGADGRAADGENATVATASLASLSPLLLTALGGLRDARVPLWQRLWCACPDSLTVLLQPTATAAAAAAPAAAYGHEGHPDLKTAAAASAESHYTGSQLNQQSQTGFTQAGCPLRSGNGAADGGSVVGVGVRHHCVPLVEVVRTQLRALSAGLGDGTAVLLELLTLLQTATGHSGDEHAVNSTDDGNGEGQSLGGRAGEDSQPHQEQDLQTAQQDLDLDQELMQQRMALWPLVGPCVDLLAGLLVHSEACRLAVSSAMARSSAELTSSSLLSMPETAEVAMVPASSTAATPLGPSGRCNRELRRGGLPYLLPARADLVSCGTNAVAAAAEAALAERRRQLRSFIYGSSKDGHWAFDTGGSSMVDAARSSRMEEQRHSAEMPTTAGAVTDAAFQEAGGTSGDAATSGVACGAACSPGKLVQLLMAVASCSHQYHDAAVSMTPTARGSCGGGMAAAVQTAAPLDVLHCVAAALKAIGTMLPAASSREALLPVLMEPQHLLVPLLSRRATPSRLAGASLLHILLENPSCVAAAATALGVPGYGSSSRCKEHEPHGDRCQSSPHGKVLNPTAARQLFIAFLDGLELDDWGQECTAGRRRHGGDGNDVGSGCWGDSSSPYKLPRLVLALLAMLLDTGHDAVIGALCCPPWLEGGGLPLRLLALADSACAPPGSKDTLEPVYPTPSNPAFKIVAKACVPSGEWLQRLRVAQEALVLLKELLTGASKGTRRAALQDLASTCPDSESQQFIELATSRLGSWPRCPGELLQTAIGQECGLLVPELAPW
ncbi:hypothetical protein VaNZ11_014871, partial [Volvox africanus]